MVAINPGAHVPLNETERHSIMIMNSFREHEVTISTATMIALTVTYAVVAIITKSAFWLFLAMMVAAGTLVLSRDYWLRYATRLWREQRIACYMAAVMFFGSAIIVGIWGFTTLLWVVGVLASTRVILWMFNSNTNYKRYRR